MTDRELLEAAARAAGIEGNYIDLLPHPYISTYEGGPGNYRRVQWNPLQDDAQALRLAVKLDLAVGSRKCWRPWRESALVWVGTEEELDNVAATRRAIVRAAAEIGRAS